MDYRGLGRRAARSALVDAVLAQDERLVVRIVAERPDIVDARNSHGHTALSEAVKIGNLALVQQLVDAGADPKQYNHGGSSLIDAAAHCGSSEIAEFLRERGCVVTPFHEAALGYCEAIGQRIKDQPSVVNQKSPRSASLLHHAAHGNHLSVCELLVSSGASVEAFDHHGHTPLCYAVERNSVDCARVLIREGANIDQPAGYFGGTVLHRAIMLRLVDMSILLLESGSDPNLQDFSGKSALHTSVASGKIDVVRAVLQSQIDTNLRTKKTKLQKGNETALDYARRLNKKRIINLLEERLSTTP
ncbi:MAG: ankyrin repeat domain-containing protein [Gammaproteobacteria bacterium]|nr:ankyrin repeat domain-containing protein [Gammaproteobacteria bacterium]